MKNVELTDQSSERRADGIDIHRTLCLWGFKMQMKLVTDIHKNHLHTSTHS